MLQSSPRGVIKSIANQNGNYIFTLNILTLKVAFYLFYSVSTLFHSRVSHILVASSPPAAAVQHSPANFNGTGPHLQLRRACTYAPTSGVMCRCLI
ncbi:hypothetical protein HID58_004437 [Brassica napus]|uniref:Uncharacterized protein n=2 Tax=Brassica TaxID=3705 RepID=A0ABQ8E5R1_BRANA|nr:hypothetical protein HID58_004437 [Brassica napus]VDC85431.1 unnamed protein product [Brassica rapa]